jgi:hypothetical protein
MVGCHAPFSIGRMAQIEAKKLISMDANIRKSLDPL